MIKLLIGNNSYAIDKEINLIRESMPSEWQALNFEEVNSIKDAIDLSRQIGFGSHRVTVVKNVKLSKDDTQLIEDLRAIPQDNVLIITSESLDGRLSATKALRKIAKESQLNRPNWWEKDKIKQDIQAIAKEKKIKLAGEAEDRFVANVGTDYHRADNAMEALKLIDAMPTLEAVDELIDDSQSNTFDLAIALKDGDSQKALELLNKIVERTHPLEMLGGLIYKFREWLKGSLGILESIHPFRLKMLKQEVSSIPISSLIKVYCGLFDLQTALKSGEKIDMQLAIVNLLGITGEVKPLSFEAQTKKRYVLVEEQSRLEAALKPFLNAKVMAIDVETTGLNPHQDKVRLIQLAIENEPVLLIDCFALTDLSPIQKVLSNKAVKVGHNIKFDIQMLWSLGLNVEGQLFDSQVASTLYHRAIRQNTDEPKGFFSLKGVANRILGESLDKTEQSSNWGDPQLTFGQLSYAAKDVEVLLPLREALIKRLQEQKLVKVAKIEFDCIYATAAMEYAGIKVDVEKLRAIAEMSSKRALELKERIQPQFLTQDGHLFKLAVNLNSPDQVKKALKQLGIDVPNTEEDTIKPYADKFPIIKDLLEYKKWYKRSSTYGEKLINRIAENGRLYPQFNQTKALTGRYSSSNPNFQNIPRGKEFRECFIPTEGYKLIVADYSQVELRVGASIAGESTMIQAFLDNEDLHRLTASKLLDKPIGDVTKQDRQLAKAVNFGLIFGMSANKLRDYALNDYGVELTEEQATSIRESFFDAYPQLRAWHRSVGNDIRKYNEDKGLPVVIKTLSGRKVGYPVKKNGTNFSDCTNSPVQGTAADITKLALGKLYQRLKGTGARLIGTVHDEILLEAPEAEAEAIASLLKTTMEEAGSELVGDVPIVAEVGIGESWADKA